MRMMSHKATFFLAFLLTFCFFPSLSHQDAADEWLAKINSLTPQFVSNTQSGTWDGYTRGRAIFLQQVIPYVFSWVPQLQGYGADIERWLRLNNACTHCWSAFWKWDELSRLCYPSGTAICSLVKLLHVMDARLVLSWPTFCDRSYDMCLRTPGQSAGSHLCTRVYCFFHPGESCNERGKPARCKTAQELGSGAECPIPCRTFAKREQLMSGLMKRLTSSAAVEKKRSAQLTTITGRKRDVCVNIDCGECGFTSDILQQCRGFHPSWGTEVCCSCALSQFI